MDRKELIQQLERKATVLRKDTVSIIREMGAGWLGGSFSSADIISALFFYRMRHDPKNPLWSERDRFIMSKAHSCEIVYAALAEAGYFPKEELKTYSHLGSRLQVHVDCRTPGIDCSGGSLGLGLSFAVGAAMGAYISAHTANLAADRRLQTARFRVYCILGDGECNEGQVWEAAQNASHYRLDNLTAIVDHNKFQSTGPVKLKMDMFPLADKFRAFGWETKELNGNNLLEVIEALDWVLGVKDRPQALIAHTLKGKGIPSLENSNCHSVNMTEELQRECFAALED
ncbi:MAG: transketolase [Deltaproteobacteria bacterium]|nr:transketolase [Deltaproteobacteria bacterium]